VTVSTLRPNSTASASATVTGASAHAATSDDSDATHVRLTAGGWVRFGLTDLSLPAGAAIKRVGLRGRMRRVVVSSTPLTVLGYVWNGTGTADPVFRDVSMLLTSITLGTFTFQTEDDAFTDSQVDAMEVEIAHGGGIPTAEIAEAYLDVTYVAVPTVAITSPSGTITTDTQPDVAWTATLDSDGGAQTYYRVVYMANGQHPDSATPVYDSGVLAGADASHSPTDPIANATYDIYVKVAQTVNGSQHWSAWDDQQDVVLNTPAPADPTLVVTSDSANGRMQIAITQGAAGSVSTDRFVVQRSEDAGATYTDVRTSYGDGSWGIPRVVGVGATADTADATSHSASLPVPYDGDGIQEDDLLIAFAAFDGNPSVSWPSDWTEIKDEAGNGSAVRVACAWKRAIGGESGTITVTTSASEGGGVRILCIRDAHPTTAPAISTGANGSGANSANPDSLNPSGWDVENTLWIAAAGIDGGVDITAAPTGYFEFGFTEWNNAAGAGIATAFKRTTAASEDPGAFTNVADDNRAFTVGVRPFQATPQLYDYEAPNGGAVTYRVAAVHDFSTGSSSQSAWVTDSDAGWSSSQQWIKSGPYPSLNVPIMFVSQPGHTRPARQGVFRVLGRSDAVVVSDARGGKEGSISFYVDEEDFETFDELLDTEGPFLIQAPSDHKWTDKWVTLGDEEATRYVDKAWSEEGIRAFPWIEVAEPTDDIAD
jgi:hypothetical protein